MNQNKVKPSMEPLIFFFVLIGNAFYNQIIADMIDHANISDYVSYFVTTIFGILYFRAISGKIK